MRGSSSMVIILTTALLSLVGGQYDANLGFIVAYSILVFNFQFSSGHLPYKYVAEVYILRGCTPGCPRKRGTTGISLSCTTSIF